MRRCLILGVFMIACVTGHAQKRSAFSLFDKKNLVAWCIVPYDNKNRNPAERAAMLKELGITQLAYDWRDRHLPTFPEEITTLKENSIKLKAVWFWVTGNNEQYLDDANHFILRTLKEKNARTELWLSFSEQFFRGLTDDEKFAKAVKAVTYIHGEAKKIGCTVQLYNHGGWFGEPENQVKIIKAVGQKDIGIVYNFHHARNQISRFPELLNTMLPYLSTVNINGMKVDGPLALTVGEGDHEAEMLRTLEASGFRGSIGILSHIEDEDAKVVLQRNIAGLERLTSKDFPTEKKGR